MRGLGVQAYDAADGRFEAVYCLNTGTSLSTSHGERDGDVLTFVEEAGDARGRSVITRKGADVRVLESFTAQGDQPERKKLEMTSTRVR